MLKKVTLAVVAALAVQAASAASIDFHGYMRAGFGSTSEGGGLPDFRGPSHAQFMAPYQQAKFRLGNEANNYSEMVFGVKLFKGTDGSQFNYTTNFAFEYNGNKDAEGNLNDDRNAYDGFNMQSRENFVSASGVFDGFLKGSSVWIGKRFYQRHDIHMTDDFYVGNTGMGAGIEGIDLGGMKFSYAMFQSQGKTNDTVTRHDFRLAGIPIIKNTNLEVGVLTGMGNPVSNTANDGNEELSYTIFGEVVTSEFFGGFNKLFLGYSTNNATWAGVTSYDNGYGDNDASLIQLIDHGFVKLSSDLEMSYVAKINSWDNTQNNTTALQIGVRPVFSLNEYSALEAELGVDYVLSSDGVNTAQPAPAWSNGVEHEGATLVKLTGAYSLQAGKGYWARPSLRFYGTYATWNDAATAWGDQAGGRFGTDSTGFTYGAQVEAWW